MRILHIIAGLGNGGAESSLFRLTSSDSANDHHVISLLDGGVYGDRLAQANVPVHLLDLPRTKMAGLLRLYRLAKEIRPDVVQTWMYHADLAGGMAARLAGIRAVVWGIRGPFSRKELSLRTKSIAYACAFFSRWIPRAIVCNSVHAMQAHVRAGYAADRLVIIANGYPLNRFVPDGTARERLFNSLDLPATTNLVGMVARYDSHKDHENLFAALALLQGKYRRNVICLLIGSGMESRNRQLVDQIERHGIQDMVRLLGPQEDVRTFMAALDVHLLSSIAESFPNVLAEAMACGTPCITTDAGDAATIVGDTGWVVPRSDPVALANAVMKALNEANDSSGWAARKVACRTRIVENYTLQRMIENYHGIWSEVADDVRS